LQVSRHLALATSQVFGLHAVLAPLCARHALAAAAAVSTRTPGPIVELTATIAGYNLVSRFLVAMQID